MFAKTGVLTTVSHFNSNNCFQNNSLGKNMKKMENKNIFNKIFQYFETISDFLKSSNFLLFSDKVVILNLSLTRLKCTFKHIKIKFNICNWNSMHMDHWLIWVYLSFLITSIRCYLSYKKFLRAIIKPLKLQTGFLFVYMAVGVFFFGGGVGCDILNL